MYEAEVGMVFEECGKCDYFKIMPNPEWPTSDPISYCTYKAHMDYAHLEPRPKPASWFNENGLCPFNTARKSE